MFIYACVHKYMHACLRAYVRTCTCGYVHNYVSLSCTNADTPRLRKWVRSGLSFANGALHGSEINKYIVNNMFVHKKRPVDTQNPTPKSLICDSTTTHLPMLSHNSIPPPPSSHCASLTPRKIRRVL
jgi:hypothetical protein